MQKAEIRSKLDNYWYYYKIHTIVGIFLFFVIIFTVNDMAHIKKSILDVSLLGNYILDDKRAAAQDEVSKLLTSDPKKEVSMEFMFFNPSSNDPSMNSAVMTKVQAMVAAKSLDILVIDKDMFESYASNGMFMRVDDIKEIPGLNNLKAKFVLSSVKDVDKDKYPYGIDVSDNEILKNMGYDVQDKVLGIVINTQRVGNVSKFLKWILKY